MSQEIRNSVSFLKVHKLSCTSCFTSFQTKTNLKKHRQKKTRCKLQPCSQFQDCAEYNTNLFFLAEDEAFYCLKNCAEKENFELKSSEKVECAFKGCHAGFVISATRRYVVDVDSTHSKPKLRHGFVVLGCER